MMIASTLAQGKDGERGDSGDEAVHGERDEGAGAEIPVQESGCDECEDEGGGTSRRHLPVYSDALRAEQVAKLQRACGEYDRRREQER
jgi:hypothetical protein